MITAKFNSRFWACPQAVVSGNEAVGVFVRLVFYAAEYGLLDGRIECLPINRRDPSNKRAIAAMIKGGLAREDGGAIVLLGRDVLWSLYNPVPLSGADRKRIKEEVIARDGAACAYCRSDRDLTLDHVIPRSRGGSNSTKNIVLACKRCNSSKSDRTPAEWLGELAGVQ